MRKYIILDMIKNEEKFPLLSNMGGAGRGVVEQFAKYVLRDYKGWVMKWTECDGGICVYKDKIIYIPTRMRASYMWVAKEYVLHEVAYINTEKDNFHGVEFYKEYIRLLSEYMLKEDSYRVLRKYKINKLKRAMWYRELKKNRKVG